MSSTMASRLIHSSRPSICSRSRLPSCASHLQFRINVTRRARGLASKASTHEPKSDTAWIIGSALVFGPALIYLLGPRPSSSVTGHGDAHADRHASKHGAAPPPVTQADAVIRSHQNVETAPEAPEEKAKEVAEEGIYEPLPEPEVDSAAVETTSDTTTTAEGGGDTSQNKEVDHIVARRSNQGEPKDAVQQGVHSDVLKTAKVEEPQDN